MGWDPSSKKEEIFHRDSRFVLLRRSQAKDGLERLHEKLPIVAYSMFRFEMEDDDCVLYWYFRLFQIPPKALFYCLAMSCRCQNLCNEVVWGRH
jgi:hypothetical protein